MRATAARSGSTAAHNDKLAKFFGEPVPPPHAAQLSFPLSPPPQLDVYLPGCTLRNSASWSKLSATLDDIGPLCIPAPRAPVEPEPRVRTAPEARGAKRSPDHTAVCLREALDEGPDELWRTRHAGAVKPRALLHRRAVELEALKDTRANPWSPASASSGSASSRLPKACPAFPTEYRLLRRAILLDEPVSKLDAGKALPLSRKRGWHRRRLVLSSNATVREGLGIHWDNDSVPPTPQFDCIGENMSAAFACLHIFKGDGLVELQRLALSSTTFIAVADSRSSAERWVLRIGGAASVLPAADISGRWAPPEEWRIQLDSLEQLVHWQKMLRSLVLALVRAEQSFRVGNQRTLARLSGRTGSKRSSALSNNTSRSSGSRRCMQDMPGEVSPEMAETEWNVLTLEAAAMLSPSPRDDIHASPAQLALDQAVLAFERARLTGDLALAREALEVMRPASTVDPLLSAVDSEDEEHMADEQPASAPMVRSDGADRSVLPCRNEAEQAHARAARNSLTLRRARTNSASNASGVPLRGLPLPPQGPAPCVALPALPIPSHKALRLASPVFLDPAPRRLAPKRSLKLELAGQHPYSTTERAADAQPLTLSEAMRASVWSSPSSWSSSDDAAFSPTSSYTETLPPLTPALSSSSATFEMDDSRRPSVASQTAAKRQYALLDALSQRARERSHQTGAKARVTVSSDDLHSQSPFAQRSNGTERRSSFFLAFSTSDDEVEEVKPYIPGPSAYLRRRSDMDDHRQAVQTLRDRLHTRVPSPSAGGVLPYANAGSAPSSPAAERSRRMDGEIKSVMRHTPFKVDSPPAALPISRSMFNLKAAARSPPPTRAPPSVPRAGAPQTRVGLAL